MLHIALLPFLLIYYAAIPDTCQMTSVSMSALYIQYVLECIIIQANWSLGCDEFFSSIFHRVSSSDVVSEGQQLHSVTGNRSCVRRGATFRQLHGSVAHSEPEPEVNISQSGNWSFVFGIVMICYTECYFFYILKNTLRWTRMRKYHQVKSSTGFAEQDGLPHLIVALMLVR